MEFESYQGMLKEHTLDCSFDHFIPPLHLLCHLVHSFVAFHPMNNRLELKWSNAKAVQAKHEVETLQYYFTANGATRRLFLRWELYSCIVATGFLVVLHLRDDREHPQDARSHGIIGVPMLLTHPRTTANLSAQSSAGPRRIKARSQSRGRCM